jgi:hypothetical protein
MNQIEYTRDQLDALIKKIEPSLANTADYSTNRDLFYAVVMGEYNTELISENDDHVIDDNFSAPLSTATAVIDTSVADLYKITLPDGQFDIMGDVIFLEKTPGTFVSVERKPIADILVSGSEATQYAFETHKGKITLYSKDSLFTAPASLAYYFYRVLGTSLPANNSTLDIRANDFSTIAERVSEYMISN